MIYFGYGSNMLTDRLRRRVGPVKVIGRAYALGYSLKWHKRSKRDGSAKCDLVKSNNPRHRAHGVLFELDDGRLPQLDQAEGRGYGYERDDNFTVVGPTGVLVNASAYLAIQEAIDDSLLPYDWYVALVKCGAREHALPRHYRTSLGQITALRDPDVHRPERKEALQILAANGVTPKSRFWPRCVT